MSYLTIQPDDYTNALWNNLHSIGHLFMGCAIAFAINERAHSIFSIEKKTNLSYAVNGLAFTAAIAASIYLAPQSTLTEFTGRQVLEFFIIQAAVLSAIALIFKTNMTLALAEGAFLGYLGNSALVPIAAVGALVGVVV